MKSELLKRCAVAACAMLLCTVCCPAAVPEIRVSLLLITAAGDSTLLKPGESASSALGAPLRAEFSSSLSCDDGKDYVLFPQWKVTRSYQEDGVLKNQDYLKRMESDTDFEFDDYGQFDVSFTYSYREKDSLVTIPGADVQSMKFTIDDSVLKTYNAFSPNGDGINDVLKIYVKSIVKMDIAIFNRWGQKLKTLSGTMDRLVPPGEMPDAEGGYLIEIWDGTYNGCVVNDGVYYLNVQAVGAGGKRYDEKSDINILKGLGFE